MTSTVALELRNNHRFLLATHMNPDGDAIGSLGALALVLEGMGKEVVAYCQDQAPGFLRFLPYSDRIAHELPSSDRFEVAVVLDCGELDRIGAAAQMVQRLQKIIHIDHHSSGNDFGTLNLVEPERSSTAEILYEVFQAIPVEVSRAAAENLYTAILTDTGSFRFANTTPRALAIAGALVARGVEPDKVASAVYDCMSPERLRLLSLSLNTLSIRAEGRLSAIWVTQQMLAETGTTAADTDGFVNYPRSITSSEIAIFFRELDDGRVNVSLRSRGTQNVAEFARMYGGGGHQNAAAFRLPGPLPEVMSQVLAKAEGFLVRRLN
jgi:bifunctional oligoribonuclease and PAP phosphatase NrnA